jgi:hypothetical protein
MEAPRINAPRDTLELYARAGETADVDLLVSLYAADGVLRSPIAGRLAFRGRDDLRTLMRAVYRVAKDPEFHRRAVDGRIGMLTGSSRVWGLRIEEAFAFDLDEDGKIETVTVHIRPLLGLTALALALALELASKPAILFRAARLGWGMARAG